MTQGDREAAAMLLAAHCRVRWSAVKTVACYLTLATEPPTDPLIDHYIHHEVRVLVPIVEGNTLDWASYDASRKVTAGPLGFREPVGPRLGAAALASADLILVPTLAVDPKGNRLGRGRGYYDRALADATAPAIAVIFDHELVPDVPCEPHDRQVDGVLRPSGYVSLPHS